MLVLIETTADTAPREILNNNFYIMRRLLALTAGSLVMAPSRAEAQKCACETPLPPWCETANAAPDALLAECQQVQAEMRRALADSLTALACEARELKVMMEENPGPFTRHPMTGDVCPYYDESSAAATLGETTLGPEDFAQFQACEDQTFLSVENGVASPTEIDDLIVTCWGQIKHAAPENMQSAEQTPDALGVCLQTVRDLLVRQYSIERRTEQTQWSEGIIPRTANNWLHGRSRDPACAGYRQIRPLLLRACFANDSRNRLRTMDLDGRAMCLNRGKVARQPR